MTFYSSFNFKLSECIGVVGTYAAIDCNGRQKNQEYTNMGKVKRLEL